MSCSLLWERVLYKKPVTFEELCTYFGANLDTQKMQVTLSWSCTKDFRSRICKKIRRRSKFIIGSYIDESGRIVIKLNDSINKNPRHMMRSIIYELHRMLTDQTPLQLEPRSKRKTRYKNRRRPPRLPYQGGVPV